MYETIQEVHDARMRAWERCQTDPRPEARSRESARYMYLATLETKAARHLAENPKCKTPAICVRGKAMREFMDELYEAEA